MTRRANTSSSYEIQNVFPHFIFLIVENITLYIYAFSSAEHFVLFI